MDYFSRTENKQKRERFIKWWQGKGLVLNITAPESQPPDVDSPVQPEDIKQIYLDAKFRALQNLHNIAYTYYGGESFLNMNTMIGSGNLATFLGSEPGFSRRTVWFNSWISDPDNTGRLTFDSDNKHSKDQMKIIAECLIVSRGKYLVGMPDLIENIDILASLRGTDKLMMDMIERPEFVKEKVFEINQAFFEVFDLIYNKIKGDDGGNVFTAFGLWGPGKTAKLMIVLIQPVEKKSEKLK